MNAQNTIFKSIPVAQPTVFPPEPKADPAGKDADYQNYRHHQCATFAALGELAPRLKAVGLDEDDYWTMIRRSLGIESRTQINAPTYARLATTLREAFHTQKLFEQLTSEIRAHLPVITCFVLAVPRHSAENSELVYLGERTSNIRTRCQAYANRKVRSVEFYCNGRKPEVFHPEL